MLDKLSKRVIIHLKKHWLKYIITPIIYVGLLAYLISYSEDNFNHTISGITYRLGDNSSFEFSEIEFMGRRTKSLLGKGKFEGTIVYGEYELDVSIHLDNENSDFLQGWTLDDDYLHIGQLYSDNSFEQLTVCIYEKGEDSGRSWNSGTGLMFSGPAIDREEALKISNNLVNRDIDFK